MNDAKQHGLWKSIDGGADWSSASEGLPDVSSFQILALVRQGDSRSGARHARRRLYSFDDQNGLVDGLVPFYLHPEVEYSIGIFREGAQVKVTANENPWHRPRGPDLGRLFSRYGGGGHHDIGSVILDRDRVQPERVVQEVLRVIQAKDG